jgi:hypothetical protein
VRSAFGKRDVSHLKDGAWSASHTLVECRDPLRNQLPHDTMCAVVRRKTIVYEEVVTLRTFRYGDFDCSVLEIRYMSSEVCLSTGLHAATLYRVI